MVPHKSHKFQDKVCPIDCLLVLLNLVLYTYPLPFCPLLSTIAHCFSQKELLAFVLCLSPWYTLLFSLQSATSILPWRLHSRLSHYRPLSGRCSSLCSRSIQPKCPIIQCALIRQCFHYSFKLFFIFIILDLIAYLSHHMLSNLKAAMISCFGVLKGQQNRCFSVNIGHLLM